MFPEKTIKNFACIEVDLNSLRNILHKIFKDDNDWSLTMSDGENLIEEIDDLNRRKFKADRFVIWEPVEKKGTCIFFSNFQDGWYTLMNNIGIDYNKKVYSCVVDEIKNKTQNGFYFCHGEKERIVRILYDAKWQFYQRGIPLKFENVDFYKKKIITERMNDDIVKGYLKKIGWDITQEDFYSTTKGIILGKGK